MATLAVPTNRAQRRAGGRAGARRKPVIAGSLLTLGGLFGAYLGYIRPPAAFAVTDCPPEATVFNPAGATPSTDSTDLQIMIDDEDRVGDTICITGGFTMNDDITITTSVTLIGNDSVTYPTIIGTGFDIGIDLDGAGATVTVKYLKLHNLDYALALCGEAGDQLTVTNSTISDSTMYALRVRPGSNGPVTCTDSNANIIIQDSTITGGTNQLQQDGDGDFTCTRTTLSNMSGYLYIRDTGDLTLDNCDLTNIGFGSGQPALVITEDSNDGSVYTDTVSISDSDFSGNDYGAIEVRGARNLSSLTITGSSFTGNGGGSNYNATVGISGTDNLSTLTISGSSFTNNTPGIGGTLFVNDSGPNLYIKDTQFTGNIATSGNGTFPPFGNTKPTGAALYSYGDLKMRNVDFTGNKTIGSGTFPVASAIGVYGSIGPIMDWDDVVVTGNGDASIDRPAVYFNDATGTIANSRFSGNFGSGAVKDLRITFDADYYPTPFTLTSITSTSVSSRSTVSIAPGSVTTVSLTYLDEVPIDNGGGSGGGSTPVSDSTPSAAQTAPTLDAISTPAPSPVTFADASKVVPGQIESLTPAQVASIPYAQFKELSPNVFGALTAAQVAALPIELVRAIRPARLAAIKPDAIAGMSGEQLSALRLASMRAMSPAQVGVIRPEVMRAVAPVFLAQLKPKVLSALGSAVFAILSAEQAAAIRPAALARLPIASLRQMESESFGALSARQLAKLTPRQVARLTDAQLAALNLAQRRALRRG